MSLVIISKELSSSNISHPKGVILDFSKTDECIAFLNSVKDKGISIYDITQNEELDFEEIISVKDHVNCVGKNPLVGRQQKLGIDFIDMTSVYEQKNDGIITHSTGKKLNLEFDFPSHYLAHIIILARTLKFKSIGAYLVNKFQ
jgi:hypothetical protein